MVLYVCITQNNKTNIGLGKTENEKENPNESCRQTVRGFPTELDKANMHRQNENNSSVQDGFYALGKAHMRFTPSLRRFYDVAFEIVPMLV